MIPTKEKAVIRKIFTALCFQFVCLCFDCKRMCLLSKTRKLYTVYKQSKLVRLHCSS